MIKKELDEILDRHKRWIEKSEGWSEEDRIDLSRTDLYLADLSGANLSGAILYLANLSGANLSGANLSRADLSGTNLCGANLSGADLSEANLAVANLYLAILSGSNLSGAKLYGANLHGVILSEAKNVPLIPYACPDFGTFIGWKQASGKIVCLEIPEDAKRLSAGGRKCRCDKAKVLSISELNGDPCDLKEIPSNIDENFIYKVGKVISVSDFNENRWEECSAGIHFFINRQEAVEY